MTREMALDDARYLRGPRPESVVGRRSVSLVDLFSGCGGLSLGVEEAARQLGARLDIRLAAEIDPLASATYAANFSVSDDRRFGDVNQCFDKKFGASQSPNEKRTATLVGANLDVLVGGPPCQGHSTLNNHTRGDDPKNGLYLKMVRAAEILLPKMVLIENVPAVERDSLGVVERARRLLTGLGYGVSTAVVSLSEIGVPQHRRRHVLVATRGAASDMGAILASSLTPLRDLRWAMADVARIPGSFLDDAAVLGRENLRRAEYLLRHDAHDLPNRLRPSCQQDQHRYKSMYGRMRWDEPAQTITTGFGSPGQGRYLHPYEPRTLTPHEAARLQFFPDWFDFRPMAQRRAVARAIGNAVPPKLSFVFACNLLSIDKTERRPKQARNARRTERAEQRLEWL